MKRNFVLGAITLSLSVGYLFASQGLPRSFLDGPVSSAGFPQLIGWTMFGASILLMLQSGISLVVGQSTRGDPTDDGSVGRRADDPISGDPISGDPVSGDPVTDDPYGNPPPVADIWATPVSTALRATGFLGLAVLFLIALPYLGYVISVFLLLIAAIRYQGMPFSGRMVLVAGLGTFAFWFLFAFAMGVPVPTGFPGAWI